VNFAHVDGVFTTIYSREEAIVLHLARPLPLPEHEDDHLAEPRTPLYISRMLRAPIPSTYRILKKLKEKGWIEEHEIKLRPLRKNGSSISVYILTEQGLEVARQLRERAQ
jgi:DNA-binding PadR family transcriptional regulator